MKKNDLKVPVYFLHPDINLFPHPEMADESGVLAVGGDLSPDRLLTAYQFGIFPWYNEGEPITWWSPDPRAVLQPGMAKISKSMRPYLKRFELRIDSAFESVIKNCKNSKRKGEEGTWITDEMENAYLTLHQKGFAHSFETWFEGELVGGLYGISLGKVFFGESMFSTKSNASKFAFIMLSEKLKEGDFLLIDCQVPNDHLMSLGCKIMSRKNYLEIMRMNILNFDIINSGLFGFG